MTPTWAIVCGVIRNEQNALAQARSLDRLRRDGLVEGVVFSTWKGEFAKHPEVARAFAQLDAIVIESEQPSVKMVGHVLHQAKAILLALASCPDGRLIIKVRPDIVPINDMMTRIISGERAQAQARRVKPTLFEQPVFVHSGLPFWPFYINDIYYCGLKADLQKMANVDIKAELLYSELAPEQFFHLAPVLDNTAAIRAFMRIQRGLSATDKSENDRYQRILLSSPFWPQVWGRYMRLLADNYYCGYTDDDFVWSDQNLSAFEQFRLRDIATRAGEMPQMQVAFPGSGAPVFHSVGWALAGVRGAYRPDRLSEAVQRAANRDHDAIDDNPALPDPEVQRLATKLQRTFSGYAARIASPKSEIQVVGGGAGRVTLMSGKDESEHLHAEINLLRRRCDQLVAQLRATGEKPS